jgi:hypothetical protein
MPLLSTTDIDVTIPYGDTMSLQDFCHTINAREPLNK